MKRITLLLSAALALTLTSCVESTGKYQSVLQQRDSLQNEIQALTSEYESTIQILNDIETGFQEIRKSEGRMIADMESLENHRTATTKERLSAEMTTMKDIMASNKAKISKLQSDLKKSGKKNKSLAETIKRYEQELEEKNTIITNLNEELIEKKIIIEGLSSEVNKLNTSLAQAKSESAEQQELIDKQTEELNRVFYRIGTKQELADAKIIAGTGMFKSRQLLISDFEPDMFEKQDKTEFFEIIFEAKDFTILSTHPEDSYTSETNENGFTTIYITDPDKFWSITKYLVIKI